MQARKIIGSVVGVALIAALALVGLRFLFIRWPGQRQRCGGPTTDDRACRCGRSQHRTESKRPAGLDHAGQG